MKIILIAIGLAILIEIFTIYLRLVEHKRSVPIKKKLHMPRIHHSYTGFAIVLLERVYLQNSWILALGIALILTDILHHLVFEPMIKKRGYDIGMRNHAAAHKYVAQLPAAIALTCFGLFALVTPFTPGAWLGIVGIGMLQGKDPGHMMNQIKSKMSKLKRRFHKK